MEQDIGNYKVRRPLAVGGMGETLLAEAPDGQLVVLKRLLPHLAGDVEAERCFSEECRIASRLDHPNIVRFLGQVEHEGQQVIVLEYVDGCSARDLLADARDSGEPLMVAEACAVVEAAARGLHFAHSLADDEGNPLSLIHRDVSPANILISIEGEVKVIDFGVAKAWDAEGRTATGVVKGKVGYMSPKQALCEPLDARADVFALGIVLWELLVGDRLFVADGPVATAYQVLEAEVSKPSARRPDVPARIDAICMNALQRDDGLRTESAAALERSLAEWRIEQGADPDLGALLMSRFPRGAPSLRGDATQLSRSGSGKTEDPTTLEGAGPRGVPLAPPPAPEILPLEISAADVDLTSTTLDANIGSQMRNVRRGKTLRRLLLTGLALAIALALVLTAVMGPELPWSDGDDKQSAAPTVFFSYEDEAGTEVIVSSLTDVPKARRPNARRIDLSDAPLTVEAADERPLGEDIQLQLRMLVARLGPPANPRADSPTQVIVGLVVPIGGALLLCAIMMWLLSRVRDGFVRWTLRLLVLFVAVVGIYRMVNFGVMGRPGLDAVKRVGAPIPIKELAPALQQLLTRPSAAPLAQPGAVELDQN